MANLTCIRPLRIPDDYDSGHDQHGESHPHGPKSQGLDIRQAKAGADESGAPQKHKQGRRCRDRQSSEAHEISARMGLEKSGGSGVYLVSCAEGAVVDRECPLRFRLHMPFLSESPSFHAPRSA
jgi:hypothetical protein